MLTHECVSLLAGEGFLRQYHPLTDLPLANAFPSGEGVRRSLTDEVHPGPAGPLFAEMEPPAAFPGAHSPRPAKPVLRISLKGAQPLS